MGIIRQRIAKEAREQLKLTPTRTLRSLSDLAEAGLALDAEAADLRAVMARYSVAVTPEVAGLIDRDDPADPIARQFLPDARELATLPQELADPIGDDAHSPVPGVVHRYPDRALLKLLTVCPVYCRFCFRRETVGAGKGDLLGDAEIDAAFAYIADTPQIREVILTGGDPLMLSARRLAMAARRLADIGHVDILRVHSRAPTAAPGLVTEERLAALRDSGKALYVALHVNHPRELSDAARAAIARLRAAGATLLSQSVLLAGVNDGADILERLMRDLLRLGVKPYYLHHPDLAPGTRHFRLNIEAGKRLHAELSRRLTGIGVPAYVLDIPGGFGKTPVAGIEADGSGGYRVTDRLGRVHVYRDDL
ncbi:MAG: lysine-2,3-aminomutase-like protein [Methylocystis sp.]|uniref:lysine-2,3-aminomutase-like protein n=1 Tax=Methylocystis sp. TaxID=1911079 RepID=UPI003DA301A9